MAVAGGHHGLGEALDPAQDTRAEPHETLRIAAAREGRTEIGARAKDAIAGPRDDHAAHGAVRFEPVEGEAELPHERLADGIRRRPVERDEAEALLRADEERLIRHGRTLPGGRCSTPSRRPRCGGTFASRGPRTSRPGPWRRTAPWWPR